MPEIPTAAIPPRGLSAAAAYELVLGVAERGRDYGWNVYYDGPPPRPSRNGRWSVPDDERAGALSWRDAFLWAADLYFLTTGKHWTY